MGRLVPLTADGLICGRSMMMLTLGYGLGNRPFGRGIWGYLGTGTAGRRFPENDREGVVQHLVNTPTPIIAGLIALLMIAGIVVVIVRQRKQPSTMRPRPAIDRASVGPGEQRRVC
jgi:hypothetical protein